jgi:TPP-dependent pyruvate/acetoin dehydrogenase alpha subunit
MNVVDLEHGLIGCFGIVGHSRSDAGAYRPEGELDSWRERDPLKIARERLSSAYGVDDQVLDRIESEVAAELDAAVQAAVAAPFPDPAAPASEFKA